MRLPFAALLTAALVGCTTEPSSSSVSESSSIHPDGSQTTVRVETHTRNGVTTGRKTETVTKGADTTKAVYEKRGDEWVKVE
jgi:hypothetical protein